jgi:hypothetical protein
METNLYHLTAEQRKERGIVALPETLGEAIDELSGSELVRKAFGPHIFDRYVEIKRKEWDDYRVLHTLWFMVRYLPVLLVVDGRGRAPARPRHVPHGQVDARAKKAQEWMCSRLR